VEPRGACASPHIHATPPGRCAQTPELPLQFRSLALGLPRFTGAEPIPGLAKRALSRSSRVHTLLAGGFGGRSSISGNRYVSRERRGWAATPTPRLTECIGGGKKYNE
jgi:hypothetical protein